MRHLTPLALIFLLAVPVSRARGAETPKRWTHGRSVCDADSPALFAAAAVDRAPLEQAWEYALQDIDAVANLSCAANASAAEVGVRLRTLRDQVSPGLRAAGCDGAQSPREQKLILVRDAAGHVRDSESFFEGTLTRADVVQQEIAGEIPAGGVPFDDCRAKAQRGWARARASLNKLSCELASVMERLDAYREHAEQAGLASAECAPPKVAQAAEAPAAANAMVVTPSPAGGGYVPFTGVDPAPTPNP